MSAKKIAIWIVASSCEVALLYFAMRNVQWCWNILRFGLWVLLVFTFLSYIAVYSNQDKEKIKKINRGFPGWVSALFDIGVAGALAAFGHFGYATLVLVQQLTEVMIFATAKEKIEKEAK